MSNEAPTDALRLVPIDMQIESILHDLVEEVSAAQRGARVKARARQCCARGAAKNALLNLLAAAPASPLPGGGWQDISTFRESGQGNPVIVAVPTKEGGWIVGEAWKSLMDADDPYRGNDGWWWAGTIPGDAYNDPIRFMNHGDAEWWMPLPAAPTGDAT